MILTKEEREKFVQWCKEHARENKLIIDQEAKLPGVRAQKSSTLRQKFELEIAACEIVSRILNSTIDDD